MAEPMTRSSGHAVASAMATPSPIAPRRPLHADGLDAGGVGVGGAASPAPIGSAPDAGNSTRLDHRPSPLVNGASTPSA